jgi:dTDP-4-dehydrorhamnose reductase
MIWLTGNKGMLGSEVEMLLRTRQFPFIASDCEVNICDPAQVREFAGRKAVSCIINCAAYTAVDRAEDEPDNAFAVNAEGVRILAEFSKQAGIRLVHVSTDYVFDGTKESAYLETDAPNPVSVYGKSKRAGEEHIEHLLEKNYIVRTAWLYGRNGPNFVHTMLRLFRERDTVRVVNDQWGSPTYAIDLAGALAAMALDDLGRFGTYHFTNEGRTTWYSFAKAIFTLARKRGLVEKDVEITPITTPEYPTKAVRPANSVLSKEKLKTSFVVANRDWTDALNEYMVSMTNPDTRK